MKLEQIVELWDKDSVIDKTEAGQESLNIPYVHNRYYKMLIQERLEYKRLDTKHAELVKTMTEYYKGTLSEDEHKELGLDPFPMRLLKEDIPQYIKTNPTVAQSALQLALQNEKVEYLVEILRVINNRGYQIKNYIDFLKFTNGYSS